MSEPWEPYYRIAADVDPAVRKLLKDSLRFIAGAADGEGMALMRKAYALNQNRPIEIQAVRSDNQDTGAGTPGVILLELNEIETTRYGNDETADAPSLTKKLVHEMYHKADPMISVLYAYAEKYDLRGQARSNLLQEKPREFAIAFQTNDLSAVRPTDPTRVEQERDAVRAVFSKMHELIKADPNILPALREPAVLSRLKGAGFFATDNAPIVEDEAVRFTDAFMAKNGCDEPWRGHYFNARELKGGETPSAIRAAQCSGLNESLGFIPFIPEETLKANALGDLTPPQVKPVTREEVRRGK